MFVANKPDYPGIDDFAGPMYHTGRWPHEPVSFEGKRVGVIGTGSSGVQAIPEIAKTAAHVTVFQRTAQYALPARNRPLAAEELQAYRDDWANLRESMYRRGGWPFATTRLKAWEHTPEERHARYEEMWAEGGLHLSINSFVGVMADEELNKEVGEFVKGKIREIVKDPDTARKLTPDYLFGTKRLILDNGYFETYNRDNGDAGGPARGSDQGVHGEERADRARRTPHRHADARHRLRRGQRLDAAAQPAGCGGVRLSEKWGTRFDTYLGMAIAGFPTCSWCTGPSRPGCSTRCPWAANGTSPGSRPASATSTSTIWAPSRPPRMPKRRGTRRSTTWPTAPSTPAPTPGTRAPTSPANPGSSWPTPWGRGISTASSRSPPTGSPGSFSNPNGRRPRPAPPEPAPRAEAAPSSLSAAGQYIT
ncbi:MAG: hypothetical protein R2755_18715 [Acidimicrobiales bacterium]